MDREHNQIMDGTKAKAPQAIGGTRLRLGRTAKSAMIFALGYAALLMLGGLTLPMYSSESVSSDGMMTIGTKTLVEVNGSWVEALLAVPLIISLVVAAALSQRPQRWAAALAWTCVCLLAALSLLGLMTIGMFLLPVTFALTLACAGPTRDPVTP